MSEEAPTTDANAPSTGGDPVHTYRCRECGEVHDCTITLKVCPDCGGSVERSDERAGAWKSSLHHGDSIEQTSSFEQF